jgi:multidrug efflux pump subunit AcrA (membrane-fusion protein)
MAAGLVIGAVLLIPVPDRVNCSAELEPQLRRYVVAPMDGTLENSLVRTGDQVTAGQTLAQLDRRPLQMEQAVLQGEYDEAVKRRDAARAKGQVGAAQLADLEVAQIAGKMAHLRHQLEQLSVSSPIGGVVVRGNLERVEGAPLTRGQSLFEVAPLSPLVAELAVPEDEVRLVEAGMAVTLWPAALPGRSKAGTITHVHPRAEMVNGQSVFIAEVILDNAEGQLRPGMQTQSVIWGPHRPLGWTLVRRPFERMTRWMWW